MSYAAQKKILKPKQRRALDVLVHGGSKQRASEVADVNLRTINRWLEDDDFNAALMAGANRAMRTAAMRMTSLLEKALQVFHDSMEMRGYDKAASIRLRAANYTIESALKLMEISDVQARIVAIEEALEGVE